MEIPPFAIRIPDRINIGTASIGKLFSALNIARTIYVALAVKDSSKALGSTQAIPNAIEIGIARIRHRQNISITTAADIYSSPSFPIF